MGGMFDDIPIATPGAPAPSAPSGMFDDIPVGAPAQKPASPAEPAGRGVTGYATDIARSVESGADRGVAGLLGMPVDLGRLVGKASDHVEAWRYGRQVDEIAAERNAKALVPPEALEPYSGEGIYRTLSPQQYEPQTRPGRFARTAAEFGTQAALMPTQAMRAGAGALAKGVAAYGVLPGVASEAAGQATEGTQLEPYARIGAGIAGAVAGGRALAPRTTEQALAARVGEMTPAERADAVARFDQVTADARARGIPLSNANALDFATGGRSDLSGMQRHVEAMGGMRDLYARQPAAVEAAARTEFDRIAPLDFGPDAVGPQIGAAARTAVEQSPQGRAFTQAQRDAGPRVTPLQAGEVIQPDQRQIFNERTQARQDASAPLYRAAEEAPERIGVDRMLTAERPGEPIVTRQSYSTPQFERDAPRSFDPPPTAGGALAEAAPESLARFVARNGGLRLDGEAAATDLHRFNVPGVGNVARPNGKGIDDFWREQLIAHGYLRPDADGGAARDITSELLRKLQNEQRGFPSYPIGSNASMPGGATAGQMSDQYTAALQQARGRMEQDLAQAGVDPASVHPAIQDRIVGSLMRGEHAHGADAYEAVVNGLREPPAPFVKSTTQAEDIYAPRFGQVNPQSVIDHIDQQLGSARGDVRAALLKARGNLFDPRTGETDLSVAGLGGARKAINAQIDDAPREVQAALLGVRNRLDAAMSVAPEYEAARATHEAFSRPLDAFGKDRPLGQVVNQEQKSGAFTLPPERVPGVIDQGATAARDLVDTGSMASRAAYEGHVRTRMLDAATDGSGNLLADSLRSAIRSNQDLLDQIPDVRRQLESVATAREGRVAVEQSPVGRLARNDLKTQQAVDALFPANPLPNSQQEISRTVGQLSAANPWAARQLVRIHAEQVFNEATQKNIPGANQMGGAKFAAVLAGNPQQADNLASAVRALPNGNVIADGFGRFIDVLEAMGKRQAVGSRTAYNTEDLKGLSIGKKAEVVAKMATGNVLALSRKVEQTMERWRLGRNLDELGRLFSDPNAVPAFRGLLNQAARGGDIRGPVARLVAIASSGARDTGPLRLTVQPNPQAQ